MQSNGYIGFITAQGFFIGIIFGVLKFDAPEDLLVATLAVTAIFYMFAQITISYFVRFIDLKSGNFPKVEYEFLLDEFSKDIKKREDVYSQKPVERKIKENYDLKKTKKEVETETPMEVENAA